MPSLQTHVSSVLLLISVKQDWELRSVLRSGGKGAWHPWAIKRLRALSKSLCSNRGFLFARQATWFTGRSVAIRTFFLGYHKCNNCGTHRFLLGHLNKKLPKSSNSGKILHQPFYHYATLNNCTNLYTKISDIWNTGFEISHLISGHFVTACRTDDAEMTNNLSIIWRCVAL